MPRTIGPFLILAIFLAPAVAAVWSVPTFVTQDGPAHLYNAEILARSFDPGSPYNANFSVRWQPLPNWAGHLVSMGLVSAFPPRVADRLVTTLTLVLLGLGASWLQSRVNGGRGTWLASLLSALLAMNVTWLFGFTGFLLGAALFPITLGVWWSGRDAEPGSRIAPGRALLLASLMVLGYFCHLVSLGLTAFGLLILETFTPGRNRRARALTTLIGLAPLVPLGWLYLGLMRQGGGMAPEWKHLVHPLSPMGWFRQLSWVDPITIARRDVAPFLPASPSSWLVLVAPVLWLFVALGLLAASNLRSAAFPRERLGWWVLAGLLLIGGIAAPDTLGASHGEYLQQRIVLLGLVAVVPLLPSESSRSRPRRLAACALTIAWFLQVAFVWDYAFTSERTAGAIARAADEVGKGRRVVVMLSDTRVPFRANPLIHADGLLGPGRANILWNDYETRHYYFPVRFRDGLRHPDPFELEQIALSETPDRAARWARLLQTYHDLIDVVVVRGHDPALDAETEVWFHADAREADVRIYRPKSRQ